MRRTTKIMIGLPVLGLLMCLPVLAYHDEGVAHCNGCHTMHNSQDGALVDPDNPAGNAWLLTKSAPSDTCLACHGTRLGAVFGDDPLNPPTERGGGNFTFLLEDNLNDGHGGANEPIAGDAAGHNIISPDRGVAADAVLTTSPGGAFPAGVMSCTSCHDPHGNGDFRLLYGVGPIQAGLGTFTAPAPDAAGLSLFGPGESSSNHTAYNDGMSAWCGNCHGDFHTLNGNLKHPSGSALGGGISTAYNLYNGTEDTTGGTQDTAYLAEVPFEDAAVTTDSTAGPSANSKVMCLSCHRAHATSAPDAGRWDFNVTFLWEDGHESGSYQIPDPYNSTNQRSLCNKCHVKDANSLVVENGG